MYFEDFAERFAPAVAIDAEDTNLVRLVQAGTLEGEDPIQSSTCTLVGLHLVVPLPDLHAPGGEFMRVCGRQGCARGMAPRARPRRRRSRRRAGPRRFV